MGRSGGCAGSAGVVPRAPWPVHGQVIAATFGLSGLVALVGSGDATYHWLSSSSSPRSPGLGYRRRPGHGLVGFRSSRRAHERSNNAMQLTSAGRHPYRQRRCRPVPRGQNGRGTASQLTARSVRWTHGEWDSMAAVARRLRSTAARSLRCRGHRGGGRGWSHAVERRCRRRMGSGPLWRPGSGPESHPRPQAGAGRSLSAAAGERAVCFHRLSLFVIARCGRAGEVDCHAATDHRPHRAPRVHAVTAWTIFGRETGPVPDRPLHSRARAVDRGLAGHITLHRPCRRSCLSRRNRGVRAHVGLPAGDGSLDG